MVQLNLATAVAQVGYIIDVMTRNNLRHQQPNPADYDRPPTRDCRDVYARMALIVKVNWRTLVDADHEAALAVERQRAPEPFAMPHEYVGIAAEVEVA